MLKDRYEIEGRSWIPISRAAHLLGTNAQGVRKLMGGGSLDFAPHERVGREAEAVDAVSVTALWLRTDWGEVGR